MDQRQIDIIGTQFFQALFQAWDQLVFAKVFNPDLSGDVQLITRYAALSNRLSNSNFIIIDLRSVDSTVAQLSTTGKK